MVVGTEAWVLRGSFTSGVSKLWPEGPIQPIACFFLNCFIGTQSCPFLYIFSLTYFALQRKIWVVATETSSPQSLKYILSDPLQKEFAKP